MSTKPKVVVDTNILISLIIGKSETLRRLYTAFVDGEFTPVLSFELKAELMDVVTRPRLERYFTKEGLRRFKELINIDTILVEPSREILLCRDPKDNMVLEAALEGADFVVTGDPDLLDLHNIEGIPILSADQFLRRLGLRK